MVAKSSNKLFRNKIIVQSYAQINSFTNANSKVRQVKNIGVPKTALYAAHKQFSHAYPALLAHRVWSNTPHTPLTIVLNPFYQ